MRSGLFLAAVAPALTLALDDTQEGILRFPLTVSTGAPINKNLTKRQNEVALESQQTGFFYSIDLELGTPGQQVSVNFDTGSAELWVNPVCANAQNPEFCESFGHFGESSTFVDLKTEGSVVYGTGYANFKYGYDYVGVGSAKIKQQIFGVAYDSSFTSVGIMGAGPDLNGWDAPYPLVIDSLAKQGLINSRAFSLDIRGIDSERGSAIFGGIDTRKYSGRLEKRPIIPAESSPDGYTRYWVYLDGITLVQDDGTESPIFSQTNGQAVLLDSGYTVSALPATIFNALVKAFPTARPLGGSAVYYEVDCSVADLDGTVDFKFGETVVKVPYADFIWQQPQNNLCLLGAFQDDEFPVLGDTFLRAAYVVYDWDNREAWIANNEDCGSNLVAIGSGPNAVPDLVGECANADATSTTSEAPTSTESTTESTAESTTESVTVETTSVETTSAAETSTDISSVYSTTRYFNTSSAATTSGSGPTDAAPTTAPTTLTSTYTTTSVYTITSCPPTVTDCPVGSVTTEVITAYTTYCPGEPTTKGPKAPIASLTSTHTSTRVYTITDCPGSGPCHKGELTTEVFTTTKAEHPQTTATYTIPKTIVCGKGQPGCPAGSTKTIERVVTITPVVEHSRPTPVPSSCETCTAQGPSGPKSPGNPANPGYPINPGNSTETHVYTRPGAAAPPTSTVATIVKPTNDYPEPTGVSPPVVTAGAAWNAPGVVAVAFGALVAAAL
ncbi:hypothetical protein ACJ41O_015145 [Fusarium nematophilum]